MELGSRTDARSDGARGQDRCPVRWGVGAEQMPGTMGLGCRTDARTDGARVQNRCPVCRCLNVVLWSLHSVAWWVKMMQQFLEETNIQTHPVVYKMESHLHNLSITSPALLQSDVRFCTLVAHVKARSHLSVAKLHYQCVLMYAHIAQ